MPLVPLFCYTRRQIMTYVASRCSVLQRVAACGNEMQCVAVCFVIKDVGLRRGPSEIFRLQSQNTNGSSSKHKIL